MPEIAARFAMAETTLVSATHNSAEFQNFFKLVCNKRGKAPLNLGLAKHRFSCYRKVLSAHVDYMFACFDTAVYIISTQSRSTPEYNVARMCVGEPADVRAHLAYQRNVHAARARNDV